MKVSCYLRVTAQKTGYCGDVKNEHYFKPADLKISKQKPDTGANELAIKLDLEIPNSLFVKPTLNFKMTIPEDSVSIPVLEAQVQDNLSEVLAAELGQKVHLSISSEDVDQ